MNSGKLDYLLERLVKINYFGLDFLNTFLMSFPLYTNAQTVFDFLEKSYRECLQSREKRRGSINPQDAVRDARGECLCVDSTCERCMCDSIKCAHACVWWYKCCEAGEGACLRCVCVAV